MRPRLLDEVVGQQHLLGPGGPLRTAFASGHPHSMILWGPPGVGKTTLARLMAGAFGLDFIALSAVLGGVKDIRDAVERAKATQARTGKSTVVFVDEVHRFNKAQQDAFLPHVESGLFIFVGATTENPSFEVVGALLSRAAVYVLEPLTNEDLGQLLEKARARHYPDLQIADAARRMLIELADGDARRLFNALEVVATAAEQAKQSVDIEFLRATLPATLRRFDKGGENFYDQISALHKSVRGSDPDAALYWMVRMLDGGTDPLYIARRAIRMASEDVGLADPRALQLALEAAQAYERLGSPEGELALAQAIVYLAVAPKSNAVYAAFGAVKSFVASDGSRPVPMHLRNAPTRLMRELGYGEGYRYAHEEEGAFAAGETYLPDGMAPQRWYEPTDRGLEQRIGERLQELRARNREAAGRKGST
ncbi:MAG TPA: replication-associated recombination protein A [Burkholderiaceae bacterium]|nr:replication-associated recombination protein A [Burkholderiaceae bacterium]